jgi:hypothetical protein
MRRQSRARGLGKHVAHKRSSTTRQRAGHLVTPVADGGSVKISSGRRLR